jgi:hypothetical protein
MAEGLALIAGIAGSDRVADETDAAERVVELRARRRWRSGSRRPGYGPVAPRPWRPLPMAGRHTRPSRLDQQQDLKRFEHQAG